MNENVVLVATTNLFEHFDKALVRRFDFVVDFNRYSEKILLMIAEKMLDRYLNKLKLEKRDIRLFRKIMKLIPEKNVSGGFEKSNKVCGCF